MKYIWSLLLSFILFGWSVVLWSTIPSGFIVEVNPNVFDVNEAVDVTIKAIDGDGNVITDYDWFVFIELLTDESNLTYEDFVLPWDGWAWLVFFEEADLWEITLSKSLIIRKSGSYTLRVYDLDDESVDGQRSIVVWQSQDNDILPISLIAPTPWSIETVSSITVLADAVDLGNSPYQILVNGVIVDTWTTSAQWSINTVITDMTEGENSLQIKVIDLNDIVLWESESITFSYQPNTDEFFNGIQILPSTQAKQWDKLVFNVSTSDAVSSAELILWSEDWIPMDMDSIGTYLAQVLMEDPWNVDVSIRLNAGWNMKLYQDVATLEIEENIAIGLVKFYTQAVDKSSLMMMWQVLGQSPKFLVNYGVNQNNLDQEIIVDTNEIEIANINPAEVYYFQITPLDNDENIIGTPSDVKEIDPSSLQAQVTCLVDGIVLRTEEIDNSYYFVWDAVENAEKYFIYRSDNVTSIISEMQKVAETTQTRFEYPFNADALNEEFAYYAVVAVCANGKEILIDEVKEVQVWPYDTLLIAIVASVLFYSVWSLYRRSI